MSAAVRVRRVAVRSSILASVYRVDYGELAGDGHENRLEPIAKKREGPWVELLSEIGVGVCKEDMA